jgi:hypothetical protein
MIDDQTYPIERETDLTKAVLDSLAQRFPPGWEVDPLFGPAVGRSRLDALLRISAPDRQTAEVIVETKMAVAPKDVPFVLQQLNEYRRAFDRGPEQLTASLLVTRFISPRTKELVEAAGASYADATGNVRFQISRPAVFIETQGASTNPWRDERQRQTQSLRGRPAARIVRAVADYRPPLSATDLAERAGTSIGSTYRMLDFLEREALVVREGKGLVLNADWEAMVRRWASDYGLLTRNTSRPFIAARGVEYAFDRMRKDFRSRYAVTGSRAAATIASYAEPRLATIFVDDAPIAAEQLGLAPAATGANVLLIEPFDDVVYQRSWSRAGINYAALTQVAADLLTSPGRGPAEGEDLLRWMRANEPEWRI